MKSKIFQIFYLAFILLMLILLGRKNFPYYPLIFAFGILIQKMYDITYKQIAKIKEVLK